MFPRQSSASFVSRHASGLAAEGFRRVRTFSCSAEKKKKKDFLDKIESTFRGKFFITRPILFSHGKMKCMEKCNRNALRCFYDLYIEHINCCAFAEIYWKIRQISTKNMFLVYYGYIFHTSLKSKNSRQTVSISKREIYTSDLD